jgi:hypothetical protein
MSPERSTKQCPPDKILNPSTNRCVKKTGAIGKKILESTKPSHTKPSHTKPSHTKPSHTKPSHTKPSHTKPSHTKPSHTKPSHTKPSHTKPSHTKPSHTKPSHTKPSHIKKNKYVYVNFEKKERKIKISNSQITTIKDIKPFIVKHINSDLLSDTSLVIDVVFHIDNINISDKSIVEDGEIIDAYVRIKKCPKHKISDPINGRCVKRNGYKHSVLLEKEAFSKGNFAKFNKIRLEN